MRVTYLSVSDQLGGSETMLLQTLTEVRRREPGWTFSVILPGSGPLAAAAAAAGADVRVVPMPAPLKRLGEWSAGRRRSALVARLALAAASIARYQRAMQRALDELRADVIHSNGFKTHVVAARLRRRPALLWHLHEFVGQRPLTRRLLARYARRADAIVANSRSVADDVAGVTGRAACTIYNGVDLESFAPDGPSADLDAAAGLPPAPPGTVRVGLVATFSRWKGHDTFLRALSALPRDLQLRGYVVGGALYDTAGSQHSIEELRARAGAHGLDGRVGFTGFVTPAAHAMRALDVVVHASTDPEPFGLVVAEAMACGRAVITSGTGGSRELVEPGATAVLHQAGDADDLAQAIRRLAGDETLRSRLGAAGRERAARLFDARRLGQQFADAYRQAVDARGAR
jgi:glycosyltransferase involved in cell wall biosynthesis